MGRLMGKIPWASEIPALPQFRGAASVPRRCLSSAALPQFRGAASEAAGALAAGSVRFRTGRWTMITT